jgi:hypothetical protein
MRGLRNWINRAAPIHPVNEGREKGEGSWATEQGIVRGMGRVIWARNARGDWIKQVMHRTPVPIGPDDRCAESCAFIDGLLRKYKLDLLGREN